MDIRAYMSSKGWTWKERNNSAILNCPFCGDTEKKFAVSLSDGAFNCLRLNNCGRKGSFTDLQRAMGDKPVHVDNDSMLRRHVTKKYDVPKPNVNNLTDAALKFLHERKFTDATIQKFRIKSVAGKNAVALPYYKDGKVVAIKYRCIDEKKFWGEKNQEPVLFNRDMISGDTLIVSEGECFPPDSELLTTDGWKRIDQYDNTPVAQVDNNMRVGFVQPLYYIKKPYDGELLKFKSRAVNIEVTPQHNLVFFRGDSLIKIKAEDVPKNIWTIPTSTFYDGPGVLYTDDEIRLHIAISADGTIDNRKGGGRGKLPREMRYARFGLKKDRKIKRLCDILTRIGLEYSRSDISNGCTSICFPIPDRIPGKLFDHAWLSILSKHQIELFLYEMVLWDGNTVVGRSQDEFSSKHYQQCVFIQTLCHLSGRSSTIMKRTNKFGTWFKVSVLHNKSHVTMQSPRWDRTLSSDGFVYCVSVPTGMVLVRQGGKIYVCGNCDAIAFSEYGIDAVSVPNGAQSMEWIEHEWEFLQRFQNIILCYDNDTAGESKIYDIANRLGLWRCYRAMLPYKDANECLIQGVEKAAIDKALAFAKDFCPVDLVSAGLFTEDVQTLFSNPEKLHGTPTPWEGINKMLKGWRDEELTVWSGRNGSGKSSLLGEVQIGLGMQNIRSCIACLEMPAARILRWMVMQYLNIGHPTPKDVNEAMAWLNEWVYIVNTHSGATPEELLNKFKYAARKYGVKHFIIDSLMRVQLDARDEYKAQTDFVSSLLTFAKEYRVHVHLVAHPRKGETDSDTPDKVDISGSGNITNLAHNVLVMWRPSAEKKRKAEEAGESPPDSKLYVKKNREFGIEGAVKFSFNESTKHFTEITLR